MSYYPEPGSHIRDKVNNKRRNFGRKKFCRFGRSAKFGTIWWNLFWRIVRKISFGRN